MDVDFDTMPDGRLMMVVPPGLTQAGTRTAPQIEVVLNWFGELKQRAPTK